MKTLLLTILFSLTFQWNAQAAAPSEMSPEQQAKLIQLLNQLEPEMLDSLLSEEALDWYIGQFTRSGDDGYQVIDASLDLEGDAFDDPNAPVFH